MHILFLMLVMVVHGGREKVVLDMRLVTSFFFPEEHLPIT